MPSHTIQSALIKLYHMDGAPWSWTSWMEMTGIRHGIFPSEDALLPKGLTRNDVIEIESYFSQYEALPTEEAKIRFVTRQKGNPLPGRNKWRDWVTSRWRDWKIHSRITEVLTNEELHPFMLMTNSKLATWPQGETYIPLVVDSVAKNLFGDESLDLSGRLAGQYRQVTQQIVQRTWININKQTQRNKTRLGALEDAATRAFDGKRSVSSWLHVFKFHWCLHHETFLSSALI